MTRSFLKLAAAILVGSVITGQAQADEGHFPYKTPYAVPVAQKQTETLPCADRKFRCALEVLQLSGWPQVKPVGLLILRAKEHPTSANANHVKGA